MRGHWRVAAGWWSCSTGTPQAPSTPNHKMTINFSWLGYQAEAHMTVRDLYKRKDLGSFRGSFTGELASP